MTITASRQLDTNPAHADIGVRGARLDVFRSADGYDCTNGGISSQHKSLTLIGWTGADRTSDIPVRMVAPLPRHCQHTTPDREHPAAALEIRRLGREHIASIVPAEWVRTSLREPTAGRWAPVTGTMFGGNYLSTHGISDLIEALLGHRFYGAVAIHDRIEMAR